MDRIRRRLSKGLILAIAYYGTAVLSLRAALVENVVTPIWPPTGIALVCLLIWGRKYWPWVTVAAFLVNLPRTSPLAAAGLAAGNTLAPLVAVTLLRRVGFDPQFKRMRDAVSLVFLGALASMTVSALAGTAVLVWSGEVSRSQIAGTWSVWWAGDALGILVFAPLILSFRGDIRSLTGTPLRRLEAVALLALLTTLAGQVFQQSVPVRYLLFPFLVWAALRFGVVGAAVATLVVAGFAVASATEASDPLAGGSLVEQMLNLQLLNATTALTSFVLAASWGIRREAAEHLKTEASRLEAAVRERTAALQEAMVALGEEVTSRRISERSLAERGRQLNEAEALAHVGSWSWEIASDVITWSDELFRIYGLEVQDARLAYQKYLTLQHPEDREALAARVQEALEHGTPYLIDHRVVRPDGEVRWVRGQARAVMGDGGPIRLVGAAQDITEQKVAEDLLRESEERYRGLVEQAPEAIMLIDMDTGRYVEVNREGERLLGRTREELMGMTYLETSAPLQPGGRSVEEAAAQLNARAVAGETPASEWILIHSAGRAVLCEVRTSYLPTNGRRLIRTTVVDITERRRMEEALAEAQERERELVEQQHIAHTLQRSLLPESLPEIPGVSMAVRYFPGSKGLEVGGDWYDAFQLPGGELALVVGDVVGRGLKAASTMGQLRIALRAYALQGMPPKDVLRELTRLTETLPEAETATLVYAIFRPDTGELTYSCAGHPPPLLIRPDGKATYLEEGRCPPLGIPELEFMVGTATLEPGSVLMLYTDGLVERRGEALDDGLNALARVAEASMSGTGDLEVAASEVVDTMGAGGDLEDDMALLVLSVGKAAEHRFRFHGPAEPERLTSLRQSFARWLRRAGADEEETHDLVLAVTEAASNVVIHAYGSEIGTFEVEAARTGDLLSVGVHDQGTWRARRSRIGGRGLKLMQSLVESVRIESDGKGTSVRLLRHLGRLLPNSKPIENLPEFASDPEQETRSLVAVVEIQEDLDRASSERVGESLLRMSNDKAGLVVDLSSLDYMDSSGVHMLVLLKRRLDQRRIQVRFVVKEDSPVQNVLTLSGLGAIMTMAESVQAAITSILEADRA